jgi:hypothetical protein
MYLTIDFAFRHGHVTSDGRFFSHIHYSQEKDGKHHHSEEELILLDVISNPSFLDAEWPEFTSQEVITIPSTLTQLSSPGWISLSLTDFPSLRAPPVQGALSV